MATTTAPSDSRFQRIVKNVPREVLTELAAAQPKHNPEKLSKDKETLAVEVFRVCDQKTISTLYDDYPGPANFAAWFFQSERKLSRADFAKMLATKIPQELRSGISPELGQEPELYRLEEARTQTIFHFAAKDGRQNLPTAFGERIPIELINYYTVVAHFSEPSFTIFGPYASSRANAVVQAVTSIVRLDGDLMLLAPKRGQSREFYNRVKKSLKAFLIETKRHDPAGNYKTITLQSRSKHPDLEDVPDFKKSYLHADSLYDVLQFPCTSRVGLKEITHVKFGHPFGRFTFKHDTSLGAISYFEDRIRELLQ